MIPINHRMRRILLLMLLLQLALACLSIGWKQHENRLYDPFQLTNEAEGPLTAWKIRRTG